MTTKGVYSLPDGRFLRRLWDSQPMPQADIDAGDVAVKDIPQALIDADELSHTKWDGSAIVADGARITETADAKSASDAAAAKEAADARAAWDNIAGAIKGTAEEIAEKKAALGAYLGL